MIFRKKLIELFYFVIFIYAELLFSISHTFVDVEYLFEPVAE